MFYTAFTNVKVDDPGFENTFTYSLVFGVVLVMVGAFLLWCWTDPAYSADPAAPLINGDNVPEEPV